MQEADGAHTPGPAVRLDRWLWYARFFKTRTLAAKIVTAGHVRINGVRAAKPAATVRPGDGLTFPQGGRIRVVRILAPGSRRGPAPEAATLYEDLDPAPAQPMPQRGGPRPTKKDRRVLATARRADLQEP